jgi:hypothetical protein
MKKYLIMIAFAIAGCKPTGAGDYNANLVLNSKYFKDPKTNLCFAALGNWDDSNTKLTYVPCTAEVEAQITEEYVPMKKKSKEMEVR